MLRGERCSGDLRFKGQEIVERGFHHVGGCTVTRYSAQGLLYPMQGLYASACPSQLWGMKNRIAEWRKKRGLSQEALGALLHSGRSTVTKLERNEIPLTDNWMTRLSSVLNCSPVDLLEGGSVPVVGKIGAGGSVVYADDYEQGGAVDSVTRPPEVDGELVGLLVEGDSMLPKFDPGDIVFICRTLDGVQPEYVNRICACRLESGETLLKRLSRGSIPGTYTLRSFNADDIENVALEWATPVVAVKLRQ